MKTIILYFLLVLLALFICMDLSDWISLSNSGDFEKLYGNLGLFKSYLFKKMLFSFVLILLCLKELNVLKDTNIYFYLIVMIILASLGYTFFFENNVLEL